MILCIGRESLNHGKEFPDNFLNIHLVRYQFGVAGIEPAVAPSKLLPKTPHLPGFNPQRSILGQTINIVLILQSVKISGYTLDLCELAIAY